jgi:hypothetical protein
MMVGTRDRRVANVGCCKSKGGSPLPSCVRLNSLHGIEPGDRIAGPDKVRCEVAGMFIPLLPVLLFAVMLV